MKAILIKPFVCLLLVLIETQREVLHPRHFTQSSRLLSLIEIATSLRQKKFVGRYILLIYFDKGSTCLFAFSSSIAVDVWDHQQIQDRMVSILK